MNTDPQPVPPPAPEAPVDVATVRFVADALDARETYESRLIAQHLRDALADLPQSSSWDGFAEALEVYKLERKVERLAMELAVARSRAPKAAVIVLPAKFRRFTSTDWRGYAKSLRSAIHGVAAEIFDLIADAVEGVEPTPSTDRFTVAEIKAAEKLIAQQVTQRATERWWPHRIYAEGDFLAALAALPPQQQDEELGGTARLRAEPAPVREWGVRHGDDCRLNHGQMRPGTYATREAAEEGAQYIKGRGLCIPVVVSRTPGGVWEPVEQEEEETAAMVEPVSVGVIVSSDLVERLRAANTAWLDTVGPKVDGRTKFAAMDARADVVRELLNAVLLGATVTAPDRFSAAEIEAAWERVMGGVGLIHAEFLAALRAGREGEQG